MTQAELNNLVSLAEHARRCGVSRAAVTHWKQQGKLTMVGDLVDHDASYKGESWHASVKAALREGQPPTVSDRATTARRKRPQAPAIVDPDVPTRMTVEQIRQRLRELDWSQSQAWDHATQEERARRGARCVGFHAVLSAHRDDGHYGGFQLREIETDTPAIDDVIAGYGFELEPWQVLQECRDWLIAEFDDRGAPFRAPDDEVEVIPALLAVLANPLYEHDKVPE